MANRLSRFIVWASVTKIQFYLQLADLLVGLGDQGLPGFALAFLVNSKQHRCSFHQGSFPGMNLARKQPTSSKETSMTSNHNFKRVYPHLLRHSDAIECTCQLGTPQDVQEHFGWSSPYMVMRYLSTLQQEDVLRINQEVRFDY
jgi:hypothetical protein